MAEGKSMWCTHCGRLDPWHVLPCYCKRTHMETKEKDVRLYYEHVTDGHPFPVKGCIGCQGDLNRYAGA